MTSILKVLGALVLAIVAVGAALLIGMRAKFTPVVNAVKQVNKRFLNPMQMKTAGQPGAYAGIIEHIGRTSGKRYETPIGPFPIDDGFLVALPYGSSPDWLKNLMAAGHATVRYEGGTYTVDQPEVVPIDSVLDQLPKDEQRPLTMFNVKDILRLHAVPNPKH